MGSKLRRNHPATAISRHREYAAGVISVGDIYRVDEAKLRLGWTDAAYRAAQRRGLHVLKSGKRCYVTGEEILRFLIAESAARQGFSPIDPPL